MQTTRAFTTRIDLPDPSRRQLIELLNARLADGFDLHSQLKQVHWNIKGSDFLQLHELYDTVAADVLAHVDTIAELAAAAVLLRVRPYAARGGASDAAPRVEPAAKAEVTSPAASAQWSAAHRAAVAFEDDLTN